MAGLMNPVECELGHRQAAQIAQVLLVKGGVVVVQVSAELVQPGFHVFVAEDLDLLRLVDDIGDVKDVLVVITQAQAALAVVVDVPVHELHAVAKWSDTQLHASSRGARAGRGGDGCTPVTAW